MRALLQLPFSSCLERSDGDVASSPLATAPRLRALCTSLAASHPGVLHNWTDHLQLDLIWLWFGSRNLRLSQSPFVWYGLCFSCPSRCWVCNRLFLRQFLESSPGRLGVRSPFLSESNQTMLFQLSWTVGSRQREVIGMCLGLELESAVAWWVKDEEWMKKGCSHLLVAPILYMISQLIDMDCISMYFRVFLMFWGRTTWVSSSQIFFSGWRTFARPWMSSRLKLEATIPSALLGSWHFLLIHWPPPGRFQASSLKILKI